jgi:uncharacterized protein with GYD domain
MPTFVTLFKFTDQGRRTIKESPKRVHEAMTAVQKMGGKVLQVLYTAGQYDMVVIVEGSEENALQLMAATAAAGNIVGETLHAYSVEDFEKALNKIP